MPKIAYLYPSGELQKFWGDLKNDQNIYKMGAGPNGCVEKLGNLEIDLILDTKFLN